MHNILRNVVEHPLNRNNPFRAVLRFIQWQFLSRWISPNGIVCVFIDDAQLFLKNGMSGGTANIYYGLHEYKNAGFMLHYLREHDLFLDVGANIGSYTVLAAKVCGADVVAIEPVKSVFDVLCKNIDINRIGERVRAFDCAVGSGNEQELILSNNEDSTNHIVSYDSLRKGIGEKAKVCCLDDLCVNRFPTVIKMDVEGYEQPVIEGAQKTLACSDVNVISIELRGHGLRYGFDEQKIHRRLLEYGFSPYTYDPIEKVLAPLTCNIVSGDFLYIRDAEKAAERVRSPRRFKLVNGWI
jgi:FkbM family methyltransferase